MKKALFMPALLIFSSAYGLDIYHCIKPDGRKMTSTVPCECLQVNTGKVQFNDDHTLNNPNCRTQKGGPANTARNAASKAIKNENLNKGGESRAENKRKWNAYKHKLEKLESSLEYAEDALREVRINLRETPRNRRFRYSVATGSVRLNKKKVRDIEAEIRNLKRSKGRY